MTCVEIKVQLVLQFGFSRGLREVLLAPVGRVYQRNVVSEFGPKTRPRCRDSENLTHWLISTQWITPWSCMNRMASPTSLSIEAASSSPNVPLFTT